MYTNVKLYIFIIKTNSSMNFADDFLLIWVKLHVEILFIIVYPPCCY